MCLSKFEYKDNYTMKMPKTIVAALLMLAGAISMAAQDIHLKYTLENSYGSTVTPVNINGTYYYISFKNKKYGLFDDKGKMLLEHKYDHISRIDDWFRIKVKEKYGAYDRYKGQVVPPDFSYVYYNGDWSNASKGKKGGIWDTKTQSFIAPCKYGQYPVVRCGYTILVNGDKVGIFMLPGYGSNWAVPCKYKFVYEMGMDFMVINGNGKKGIYNRKGELIVPLKYKSIKVVNGIYYGRVNDNAKYQSLGAKHTYYNIPAAAYLTDRYDHMTLQEQDYLIVQKNRKYGVVDKDGKEILEPEYGGIYQTKARYIKDDGKIGINYFWIVTNNGYKALYSIEGKKLIDFERKYTDINCAYSLKFICVKRGEKYGVCRMRDFREMAEPVYNFVDLSDNSECVVLYNENYDKIDIVNEDSRLKEQPKFKDVSNFELKDKLLVGTTDKGGIVFNIYGRQLSTKLIPQNSRISYSIPDRNYYFYNYKNKEKVFLNIGPEGRVITESTLKKQQKKKATTPTKPDPYAKYPSELRPYAKLADEGDAGAQNYLGHCYYMGQGVSRNYTEAVKWFKMAAQKGQVNAEYNLGLCYEKGNGVTQNLAEAMKWYEKAAGHGNTTAAQRLQEIRKIQQSYSTPVYNNTYQQQQNYNNDAQTYMSIYKGYESEVISHWNALRVANDYSYTSIYGAFRTAQTRMANTRMEAAGKGISIPMSPWETQSAPMRELQ